MTARCECGHAYSVHTTHGCNGTHLRTDHDVIDRTDCTCAEFVAAILADEEPTS